MNPQASSSTPPSILLSAANLGMTYPNGFAALHAASLEIRSGQFIVLLGPSGAGKSTLLRCLNGLVRPTAGSIRTTHTDDIFARGMLRAHRQRTGMVFQQHQLLGRLSALANVLIGRLGFHGSLRALLPLPREDKIIALAALDKVGLLHRALQRADSLSGGEQQRVGIARALAQQPQLLLADEPVASLDPATAIRVLALMHAICKAENIAAVVSLHQVELARRFADRIIGIAAGTILFDDLPAALDDNAIERIYGSATAPRNGTPPFTPPLEIPSAALAA